MRFTSRGSIWQLLTASLFFFSSAFAHETAIESKILDLKGQSIGTAQFIQGPEGVLITLSVTGLPPGKHGMHFHAAGLCEPDTGFKTAGGHVMEPGKPHGFLHPKGPHAGNLPNLMVHPDGTANVELYTSLVALHENAPVLTLYSEQGTTLIIHANEDDHQSQPIGGSGARIACGIIFPPKLSHSDR